MSFRLSLISRLKLIGSFEVGYNTLDFLRERIVIRRLPYGSRIGLYGIRERILKVSDLRIPFLALSAYT